MPKTSLIVRLAAFCASAVVTLAIVAAVADYGLPADNVAPLMARATPVLVK